MELTIQSSIDSHDKISLTKHDDCITVFISRLGNTSAIDLSAFEAQTIASALLQMAKRLENNPYDVLEEMPQDEPIIEDMTDYQIEKMRQERQVPIGKTYQSYEKTLNERIEYVHSEVIGTTIRKLLKMQSGIEVFATSDIWDKESHLQGECDNDFPSFMNIKLDAEANWWLVDCLPF